MRCHSSSAERCILGYEGRVSKRYIAPSAQRMPSGTPHTAYSSWICEQHRVRRMPRAHVPQGVRKALRGREDF